MTILVDEALELTISPKPYMKMPKRQMIGFRIRSFPIRTHCMNDTVASFISKQVSTPRVFSEEKG